MFCHGREGGRRDREHLVSRPVASAFGIDRLKELSSVDMRTGTIDRTTRLEDLQVRLPCDRCNSGWMNELEHGMAAIAKWVRGRRLGLASTALRNHERWLVKTAVLLGAIDGDTRNFMRTTGRKAVVPDASRARKLYESDDAATAGVTFGYARLAQPFENRFAYLFGNPTVVPTGERHVNVASATALMVALGELMSWAVLPVLSGAQVTLPGGTSSLRPGMTFRALPSWKGIPELGEVVVDNGEHDINDLFPGLPLDSS